MMIPSLEEIFIQSDLVRSSPLAAFAKARLKFRFQTWKPESFHRLRPCEMGGTSLLQGARLTRGGFGEGSHSWERQSDAFLVAFFPSWGGGA